MITRFSVNLNKFALIRNSRGNNFPDLTSIAQIAIRSGVKSITLHPREDARHATLDDVIQLSCLKEMRDNHVEVNIEGDLREELIRTVYHSSVEQFTIVPVVPGEITSNRGWRAYDEHEKLTETVRFLRSRKKKIRISVFADATQESVSLCANADIDAVEFYTGDYAMAKTGSEREHYLNQLIDAAVFARSLGLQIHAGHDLNLENLPPILEKVKPEEVSIGHSIICESLLNGFQSTIKQYLRCIEEHTS